MTESRRSRTRARVTCEETYSSSFARRRKPRRSRGGREGTSTRARNRGKARANEQICEAARDAATRLADSRSLHCFYLSVKRKIGAERAARRTQEHYARSDFRYADARTRALTHTDPRARARARHTYTDTRAQPTSSRRTKIFSNPSQTVTSAGRAIVSKYAATQYSP